MSGVGRFEFVLVLLTAIVALEVAARRLRAPPAAALMVGGGALAFVPGVPPVQVDPDLVLTLFLPPLLMSSAFFTSWRLFRQNITSILLLAVGAVAFTTACVGVAVKAVVPGLPWAACLALGAIVSPPDAVAAKAVLDRVSLPRRTAALLEGESLLNDATGIVLYKFAVVAALTGSFSLAGATASFVALAVGGIAVGALVGWASMAVFRRLGDNQLRISLSLLVPYASYIGADRLGFSGVIAVVVTGLILGWFQHELFSAVDRRSTSAVWETLTYLLEAFVFVLIGLSLRGVVARLGGSGRVVEDFGWPVLAVIASVVLSRFAWVMTADVIDRWRHPGRSTSVASAVVIGWAGMRGVVTLAIALSAPASMPGRDLMLVASFAVILVTVLGQGSTLGVLIRRLGVQAAEREGGELSEIEALAALASAQLAVVETLAHDAAGTVVHPRLLEQYRYRATLFTQLVKKGPDLARRRAHYDVVLAALAAGRAEILRLHRAGLIHDDALHALEHDLDLQEISAQRVGS